MRGGKMRGRLTWAGSLAAVIVAAMSGASVQAHERWFVEAGAHAGEALPAEVIVPSAILVSFGFLAFGLTSTRAAWYRKLSTMTTPPQGVLPAGMEWRLVGALAGIMLLANAISGTFLSSELRVDGGWLGLLETAMLAFVGLLLLSQLSFALAGLLVLLVAMPVALVAFPLDQLIDYLLEYAALGLALVFVGLSSCPGQLGCSLTKGNPRRFAHLPLPIIRIGLGLSLIVLAVHNKLLEPDVALTFLDRYDFNFMAALGLSDFSNLHFVFLAGLTELGLGVLLAAGVATRATAAVLFGFFMTTLFALGVGELIGHLPLFGIAIALIYRGSGRFSVESIWTGGRRARPATAY